MFTMTKIALAATIVFGAASAALANDRDPGDIKWYPETLQEISRMNQATDTFRGNANDSAWSTQKPGSSQKKLRRHEN